MKPQTLSYIDTMKAYVPTVVPLMSSPIVMGYVILFSADYIYDYNNCSRIDKLGSYICESSHTVFTETRKCLKAYIHQGVGTIIGLVVSILQAKNVASNKVDSE